jgi:uncharacterized repeat protein (TIGR01451 family)
MGMKSIAWLKRILLAVLAACAIAGATPAAAQTCGSATTQGSAPAGWQTYCWLDFSTYNDATARSIGGQNFAFTLSDGSVLSFNLRATSTAASAATAIAAPSWTGAAVGNSAFIGIPGRPVLYMANSGSTVNFTISSILITPPPGAPAVTAYAFVAADAESTDGGETIQFGTNGGGWILLDQVNATSGPNMPTQSGIGTSNFTTTGGGLPSPTGGYIVGTSSPTQVTAQMVGSGLQGVMFAVRFASIRLNKQIGGARVAAADQFTFRINATSSGTTLATGTTTGTGLGPFTAAAVSLASGLPLTINESMAAGSASTLSQYRSVLNCTNGTAGSPTVLPTNVETTSYAFGSLSFGDAIQCVFTNTPHPHIRLRKALGTGGRRFNGDQFTVRIMNGTTVISSSTTTGTTTTLAGGDTAMVQLVSGTAYSLDELASGTANLGNYTSVMACTNTNTTSTTVRPTTVPGPITPVLGDVITCTLTNTRRSSAVLAIEKVSTVISDPVNGTTNPKMIPGTIVEYAITVTNVGNLAVDASTIVLTDPLPANVAYDTTTGVSFTNGTTASGLNAFNVATMVTYSNQVGGGAPFTYTPSAGFDANMRGLRIAPTGTMAAATGTTQPSFTVRFRARVN